MRQAFLLEKCDSSNRMQHCSSTAKKGFVVQYILRITSLMTHRTLTPEHVLVILIWGLILFPSNYTRRLSPSISYGTKRQHFVSFNGLIDVASLGHLGVCDVLPLHDSPLICVHKWIKWSQCNNLDFLRQSGANGECFLLDTPLLQHFGGLFQVLFINNCTYILLLSVHSSCYRFRYQLSGKHRSMETCFPSNYGNFGKMENNST